MPSIVGGGKKNMSDGINEDVSINCRKVNIAGQGRQPLPRKFGVYATLYWVID